MKEKLANLVLFDKPTYDKMLVDVPKLKLITPSIISEKLKVNGSLARKAVKELVSQNLIRACIPYKLRHCATDQVPHTYTPMSSGCNLCVVDSKAVLWRVFLFSAE